MTPYRDRLNEGEYASQEEAKAEPEPVKRGPGRPKKTPESAEGEAKE